MNPARTLYGQDGRVLLFSCDQFVEDICLGDSCFICGARPGTRKFNNEHVIPRWVLRRFNLFDQEINLPNGEYHTYRTYQVPCCEDCNTFLGQKVEIPVSHLLKGSFEQIVVKLDARTCRLLFIWLCLLFIKIHLKDRFLSLHRDPRKGCGTIAEQYYWQNMHHVHAVARAPFVAAEIDDNVIGSIRIFSVHQPMTAFDWVDLTEEQTVALRVGDLGIVAVLNDAGAAQGAISHILNVINGPLSSTQLREVAARMAVANADLINRPTFGTQVIWQSPERVRLWARTDSQPNFAKFDPRKFGEAMAFAMRDGLEHLQIDGERGEEKVRARLLTGRVSFIFDQNGDFVRQTGSPAGNSGSGDR